MTSVVLQSLADAYMSIGTLVFALAGTGIWLFRIFGERISAPLSDRPGLGPLFGAAATLPPGCIGVLAVARLYSSGRVTYGTLLAAFLATMGDSAWLLLATHPMLTVGLKAALVLLGVAVGSVVDRLGVLVPAPTLVESASASGTIVPSTLQPGSPSMTSDARALDITTVDTIGLPTAPSERGRWSTGALALVSLAALPLSTAVAVHAVDQDVVAWWWGGPHAYLVLGSVGFALSLVVLWRTSSWRQCGECGTDTRAAWVVGVREASRVTVWAGAAFVIWDLLATTSWFAAVTSSPLTGIVAVVTAALIGLIPACGVELAVAGLFVAGGIPLPGLITYLISQDGSGFIPLALSRPRAAMVTTAMTTAISAVVGTVLLVA
ncbi:putative manganese transporter [Rhodococcus sp. MEB064]|uniref:putative manganese transporter n=1 Tax=Rhodococcus sp. MEB064 TaxID=1587522 RepID=UPI0005ABD0CD|nr:putative manganese transporter [Rhodococcus sp. MEB064]KIQ18445.1 hypothetical protein RU01_07690 [Rhodococcus sp. MEB064]